MAWLRLHLFVVTALTLSGHVAVLTASSAVLYVLSPGTTGTSESCPLNLTADKSCSMTHCQMHRDSLNPDSTDSSNDKGSAALMHRPPTTPLTLSVATAAAWPAPPPRLTGGTLWGPKLAN